MIKKNFLSCFFLISIILICISCKKQERNTNTTQISDIKIEQKISIDELLNKIQNLDFENVTLENLDYEEINTTIVLIDESFGFRNQIVNNEKDAVTQKMLRYTINDTKSFIVVTIGEILTPISIPNQYLYSFSDDFINKNNNLVYYDSTSLLFDHYVINITSFDPTGNLDTIFSIKFKEKLIEELNNI